MAITKIIADSITSGAVANTPAFEAYGDHLNVSDNVYTKVPFANEVFDTNNNFASNRFTPTVAGKYACHATVRAGVTSSTAGRLEDLTVAFYKNGSAYISEYPIDYRNNPGGLATVTLEITIDFNGSGDYLEVYGRVNVNSNTPAFYQGAIFGAYRILT